MDDRSPAAHFAAAQPHPCALPDCTSHGHGLSLAWSNNHPEANTSRSRHCCPAGTLPWHTQHLVHSPDISHTSRATTQTREFIRAVRARPLAAAGTWHLPPPPCCRGRAAAHRDTASPTSSHRPARTHSGSVRPKAPGSGLRGRAGRCRQPWEAAGLRESRTRRASSSTTSRCHPGPPPAPEAAVAQPSAGLFWEGGWEDVRLFMGWERKVRGGGNNPAGCSHQPLPAAAW